MNNNYANFNQNPNDFYVVGNQDVNYIKPRYVVPVQNSSYINLQEHQSNVGTNSFNSMPGSNGPIIPGNVPLRYINTGPQIQTSITQWMPQTVTNRAQIDREPQNFSLYPVQDNLPLANHPSSSLQATKPNSYPEIQVIYSDKNVGTSTENINGNPKSGVKRSHSPEKAEKPKAKRFANVRETRFFTGNIESIIKWHQTKSDQYFCLYEVFAPCIMIRDGIRAKSTILLLRDDTGPVLQVDYYEQEVPFPNNIQVKSYIRCVGRMIGSNRLLAMDIREASTEVKMHLQRMTFISDHAFNRTMKNIKKLANN